MKRKNLSISVNEKVLMDFDMMCKKKFINKSALLEKFIEMCILDYDTAVKKLNNNERNN